MESFDSADAWGDARRIPSDKNQYRLPFVAGSRQGVIILHAPERSLPVICLQEFLTAFEQSHADVTVDYIHGEEAVHHLGGVQGNIGIFAEVIDKHALFPTIRKDGPLPRKSFSLGGAEEKRYYLECRRIS